MEKKSGAIPKPISRLRTIPTAIPTPSNMMLRRRSKSYTNLTEKLPKTNLESLRTRIGGSTTNLFKPPLKPVRVPLKKTETKSFVSTAKPQTVALGSKRPGDKATVTNPPKQARFPPQPKILTASEMKVVIKELRTQVKELTKDAADSKTLKDKLEHLEEKYENLEKDHKVIETDLNELRTQFDILTEKNNKVEESYNNLKTAHTELKLSYNNMERDNEILQNDLQNALQRIQKLESTNSKYKEEISEQDMLRRNLHNTIQTLKGNIRVFCRIRPPTENELNDAQIDINIPNENCMEIRKAIEDSCGNKTYDSKLEFNFDRIFPPESSQEEVFEDLSQLVQSALDGYDVCVFAYGQTGSGKTFTMQGEEIPPEKLGMIPRSVDLIFKSIEKFEGLGWQYTVKASFLEIYNETVRDLLDPLSSKSYELRYNEGKGTTVTNLIIKTCKSAEEMKKYLVTAQQNRAVAVSNLNEHSSRSHSITKIYLEGYNENKGVTYTGSVNLIDLAGSESAKLSERMTETKHINKSLSALNNVMLALFNNDHHVPYRNSKLTFLLQSCLGGSSKTLMFVNISPFKKCYSESINSLKFGTTAKQVKHNIRRNKNCSLPPVPSKFVPS